MRANRLEEQEPDFSDLDDRPRVGRHEELDEAAPRDASWLAQVETLEAEGLALANEALRRTGGNAAAAEEWLMTPWRSKPDDFEQAIRTEALAHVRAAARAVPVCLAFRVVVDAPAIAGAEVTVGRTLRLTLTEGWSLALRSRTGRLLERIAVTTATIAALHGAVAAGTIVLYAGHARALTAFLATQGNR